MRNSAVSTLIWECEREQLFPIHFPYHSISFIFCVFFQAKDSQTTWLFPVEALTAIFVFTREKPAQCKVQQHFVLAP